jgi:hypothetical protein
MRTRSLECPPLSNQESSNDFEYDRLLDAVRMALAAAPEKPAFNQPAKIANDNQLACQLAWVSIPFPEGWYGVG